MDALRSRREQPGTSTFGDVQKQLESYAGWVAKVQNEQDPFGQSVLAEPKYFIPNATVYSGGWCRPQNDGPGLRSRTLIMYAEALEQANQKSSQDLWKLIQTDLDWQAANWQAQGCDLWEEIRSDDFFWNRRAGGSPALRGLENRGGAHAAFCFIPRR